MVSKAGPWLAVFGISSVSSLVGELNMNLLIQAFTTVSSLHSKCWDAETALSERLQEVQRRAGQGRTQALWQHSLPHAALSACQSLHLWVHKLSLAQSYGACLGLHSCGYSAVTDLLVGCWTPAANIQLGKYKAECGCQRGFPQSR